MNITQVELSRRVGCTPRHINQVFRKHRFPSVKLAKKIERETGIPWTSWFDNAANNVREKQPQCEDA